MPKLRVTEGNVLRIAVCEDQTTDRDILLRHLKDHAFKMMLHMEISSFGSGEELLELFAPGMFQLVFLDIFMTGITGVETAFRIRKMDPDCVIVFVSTSPSYRAEGFEVGAVHYLIKPLTPEGIEVVFSRCRKLITEMEKSIEVTVDRRPLWVLMGNILYAEVYGKTVLIHTVHGVVKTRASLGEMADKLREGPFLLCHRCYIVNLQHVAEVEEADFLMQNGSRVPIRKNGRQLIREAYIQYAFDMVRRRQNPMAVRVAP